MRRTIAFLLASAAVPAGVFAQGFGETGFSISRGEDVIAGSTPPPYRPGYAPVDEALRRADVTVQFDSLERTRLLNVATADMSEAFAPGETVTFRASTNYPAFVDRAEIRIVDRTQPGGEVLAVLPVAPNGSVDWVMPADAPERLGYVLRVTSAAGQFDETIPAVLSRVDSPVDAAPLTSAYIAAGEGEDRTAIRGIPVQGGTVTVSGTAAAPGGTIRVMGESVPVDGEGRFATARILPVGDQVIEVEAGGRRHDRWATTAVDDPFGCRQL